jgi:hypothetical protein
LTTAPPWTYHSAPKERGTAGTSRRGSRGFRVIDLARVREARRLCDYQCRLRAVLENNRRALGRLFQSGLIFSRQGSRLGRDLLLAHQHLLKVSDLLSRLGDVATGSGGSACEAEELYAQVQSLLSRTTELTARSDVLLARQR